MQVERAVLVSAEAVSGRRVSNAWIIYLRVGDTIPKGVLIPHNTVLALAEIVKAGDPGNWTWCMKRSSRQIS